MPPEWQQQPPSGPTRRGKARDQNSPTEGSKGPLHRTGLSGSRLHVFFAFPGFHDHMVVEAIKPSPCPEKGSENQEEGHRAQLPVQPPATQKEKECREGKCEPVS